MPAKVTLPQPIQGPSVVSVTFMSLIISPTVVRITVQTHDANGVALGIQSKSKPAKDVLPLLFGEGDPDTQFAKIATAFFAPTAPPAAPATTVVAAKK